MIRPVSSNDAERIADIYNHYITNTLITFEEEIVSAGDIDKRIIDIALSGLPWLVIEENGEVNGYAYASRWNGRCSFRFSVEITVYLSHLTTSRGLGTKLFEALFSELRKQSVHVAIGGIALPNPASIALHEKFGMEKVAHFKEVGFKFDQWIDVGYWQATLDTRKHS